MKQKQMTATILTSSELATDHRLHKLSKTLEQAGYQCEFVCRIKSNHLPFKGTNKVHYLNTIWQSSALFYLIYNLRIFFFLLFHKTNLIISIDLDTLVGCGLAKLFKQSKLIFDSHEYFPESPEINTKPWIKAIWKLAEKFFIPLVDIGITVCQPIADIYKNKYNKDFLIIRNAPSAKREIKETSITSKQRLFTILYQGAVNNGRALRELVQAMNFIEEAQLIIVGSGDIFEELKKLSDPLGDKVLMTGKVPFDKVASYTANADLGIALLEDMGLNNYYALPNRLFDSLHAGLPMLGINFPEIEKFINEYKFGTTIDNIEPQNIAKAINKIINNPSQLKEWHENALSARKYVNWEDESHKLISILKTN
ncbi:glycosyltransferase [uncultured Carboxylicivirga sp.]|uniref:glycosyltransferase n=2 Tax=Carboxylicivirga TaxID=1628153 RepID=UPI00259A1FE8|nr:glycosyltransferase [uncultured Carboxylicivirga sp.]